MADKMVSQVFRRPGGKKTRVRVSQRVDLRMHCLQHLWVTVTQTGNRGAARCVDILVAPVVDNANAAASNCQGKATAQLAVKDAAQRKALLVRSDCALTEAPPVKGTPGDVDREEHTQRGSTTASNHAQGITCFILPGIYRAG